MANIKNSNLEPLDESDLNLKEKFTGGSQEKVEEEIFQQNEESAYEAEKKPERIEGAVEKEEAYTKILSQVSSQSQSDSLGDVTSDANTANLAIDAESKITNLVNLAETKGVVHAVKVARHMEDNYTLDEFHDRLLGEELHQALLKKGLIKEI